jgi:hypothetical protein
LSRFKLFELQNEINHLTNIIDAAEHAARAEEIAQARDLIQKADGAGFLRDEVFASIQAFADKKMAGPDGEEPYLTEDELTCLLIRKGTLTDGERAVMESHAVMTRRMLQEMSFPKDYRSVPKWAGSHHEHINGMGYPDKLIGDDISVEIRIITILDIYEALTAADRPYRRAMTPDKAFAVLDDMAAHGQIDADVLSLFKQSGIWEPETENIAE